MSSKEFLNSRFQSTPSVGRATLELKMLIEATVFQSTPSVGKGDDMKLKNLKNMRISIHALRGEGDYPRAQGQNKARNFNPRPPWGGRL